MKIALISENQVNKFRINFIWQAKAGFFWKFMVEYCRLRIDNMNDKIILFFIRFAGINISGWSI